MEEIDGNNYIQVDEKTIILQSNSSPRLTPTGKISYAKTRVYTQRYRKEWEFMSDFKGWLTAVKNEPTRAYCKYCKKDLHAHRLSLLKHTCTMKHHRAALMHQNAMLANRNRKESAKSSVELNEDDFTEAEEIRDDDEEGIEYTSEYTIEGEVELEEGSFSESKYVPDVNEEEEKQKTRIKKIKLDTAEMKRDKLAQAMAHVHVEVAEEDSENVDLDMDVTSETVETCELSEELQEHISDSENLNLVNLESGVDHQVSESQSSENEQIQELEFADVEMTKPPSLKKMVATGNTFTVSNANTKTIVLRSDGKAVSLASGKVPSGTQYVISNFKGKPHFVNERKFSHVSIAPKSAENESSNFQEASTSQPKKVAKITKASTFLKKPTISTHVTDMGKGLPIGGLQVSLYKLLDGRWTFLNECTTSATGKCTDLINSEKNALTTGRYKLHFDVDKYFSLRKIETLYPFIEIVFDVKNIVISYHIPILLSPFGYTTYRGADR